jgi:hypothetical protein
VGKEESGTGSVPLFVQYSYPQRGHSYCKWTLFEEAHHRVGRSVEEHDARPEEIVEEAHERRDEQRCPLRPGYGHALGCKLAEDDVQEGYSAEGRGEGDDVDGTIGYT